MLDRRPELFLAVTISPREHAQSLVQSPNSCFVDVKCPGSDKITTVFSHAQTVILCAGCSTVLCQPTGGKARLTHRSMLLRTEAALKAP
uniref:40S ribosomal protein S27 n=1 Tax=Suricata suricatta TaxID=37032 RepID=A0A673SYY8_SURSU